MFTKPKKTPAFYFISACLWRPCPSQQPLPSHKNRGSLPNGVPMIEGVLSTD